MGMVSHTEKFNKPPAKLATTAKRAESNMPKFLFRKLPATSLGELKSAPTAMARPISILPKETPATMGTIIPKPKIIAFVKSVLFKKSKLSLYKSLKSMLGYFKF